MKICVNFRAAIEHVGNLLRAGYEVKPNRWQSMDVSKMREATMKETLNVSFQVMLQHENVELHARDIEPNLPWAEDHFQERVSGKPLNPGVQWRNWPWSLAADKHRTAGGDDPKFSHTYMERYFPRHANGSASRDEDLAMHGIRYPYGDLDDVVSHLLGDSGTRQAYLPVWFPEDTGVVHGERVPCSLGYHWILRNGYFYTSYFIRSCDFYRHFRDDLYLTLRLTQWILELLRGREPIERPQERTWREAKLGMFSFHCVSMHCFINDWNKLFGAKQAPSGSIGAGSMGLDRIRNAQ